ncbi:MAG: hypothetical protein ACHQRM_09730 [Bacteroidia bacterium]
MALNQNHPFEELEGIKCAVVEKSCSAERVNFLKQLLELNRFTVVVVKCPPPKAPAKPASAEAVVTIELPPPVAETFTVGVTDLSFNPVNAIYNRELLNSKGKVVSPHFWKANGEAPIEDMWYWKK